MALPRATPVACTLCLTLLGQAMGRGLSSIQAFPADKGPKEVRSGRPIATLKGATAFGWRAVSNLDCPATCSAFGSPAINGGTSGQALCGGTYQGVTYYGLWKQADKKCHFSKDSAWWSFTAGYYCACTSPSYTLAWEADSACAVAPRAAATDPAACRYAKYNSDGPWTMGYYIGDICYAIGQGFGPTGQTWSGIKGGLGYNSYKVQLLCASAASTEVTNDALLARCMPYIKTEEGFSRCPYYDAVGKLTVGYGVLTSDRYTCYTEAQASEQLKSLLASKYIPAAATLPNWSSMNINQRCAMLSMTYNCYSVTNPASFPKCHGLLKAKDWVNAPKECMDCVKGINGVVLLGLQSRRLRETKIWAMPTAGSVPCCASAKQDVQTCISNIKNQCICPSSDSTTTCKNRALAWCPPYTNGCVYGQTF